MDSYSCRSLHISCWTLISFSSSAAALISLASSSQSYTWIWSSSGSPWMTWSGEGALEGDWCGAPLLVWVELADPPFWLEPAAIDMLADCGWTCGMVSKVGCYTPSCSIRLDGDVGWVIWMASLGLPLGLEHGGRQMLRSNSRGLLDPEHRGKMRKWIRVRWRMMVTKVSTMQWIG
jgi:hypothetical protein